MPVLPFILSLSLHVRDPSIQRASSPIFSLLWIFRERKCQFMVGLSVSPVFIPPSSHLSEQSSKESCPLDHWVPPGSRLLLQVLCLGHPFNSLLTCFWFCQPCMLFLFSVVPSSYPRKFCFFFFFLLFFFSFRRYSHNCHKSVIKWIDLWRRGILEHFLPWLLWSLWYYLHLYPSWDIIVWMAGQLRWVKNSLNDQVCRVFVRGH